MSDEREALRSEASDYSLSSIGRISKISSDQLSAGFSFDCAPVECDITRRISVQLYCAASAHTTLRDDETEAHLSSQLTEHSS